MPATSVCAVLLAEACNTGLEPLVRPDVPALRRARLSWVSQNFIRAETIDPRQRPARGRPEWLDLAQLGKWRRGLRRRPPLRGAGAHHPCRTQSEVLRPGRGITYYNLVSDQFTGLNAIVVPGTLRDSLLILGVVLEQETDLEPIEIMTDTAAYADMMFGIFWLLGYQFSPRIADIGGARFWRIDPNADYGVLDQLARTGEHEPYRPALG